eukprot:scaffold895_cov405-Pavlova_lutheri.AAC.1
MHQGGFGEASYRHGRHAKVKTKHGDAWHKLLGKFLSLFKHGGKPLILWATSKEKTRAKEIFDSIQIDRIDPSVSFGHSHTCLGGEHVSGRSRCTGLGRGSSHSRTKSPSSRLEAWYLARSTSWWLGKRVGLSKSLREDGRRRAGGWQSQNSITKQRGTIGLPLSPPLTGGWNWSKGGVLSAFVLL